MTINLPDPSEDSADVGPYHVSTVTLAAALRGLADDLSQRSGWTLSPTRLEIGLQVLQEAPEVDRCTTVDKLLWIALPGQTAAHDARSGLYANAVAGQEDRPGMQVSVYSGGHTAELSAAINAARLRSGEVPE